VATHITIGLQLAITILLFVYGGYYIDSRYDKSPVFTTIGAFLGMILGFYSFMREIQQEEKMQKTDKEECNRKEKKRIRWM